MWKDEERYLGVAKTWRKPHTTSGTRIITCMNETATCPNLFCPIHWADATSKDPKKRKLDTVSMSIQSSRSTAIDIPADPFFEPCKLICSQLVKQWQEKWLQLDQSRHTVNGLSKHVQDAKAQNEKLQLELAALQVAHASAQNGLGRAHSNLSALEQDRDNAFGQLDRTLSDNRELQLQLQQAKQELDQFKKLTEPVFAKPIDMPAKAVMPVAASSQ